MCEETRVQERARAFDVRERTRRRVSLRALFRVKRRRRRRRRRPQRPDALTMPLCSTVQVAASRSSVGIEISRPWGRPARAARPRSGGPSTVYVYRERDAWRLPTGVPAPRRGRPDNQPGCPEILCCARHIAHDANVVKRLGRAKASSPGAAAVGPGGHAAQILCCALRIAHVANARRTTKRCGHEKQSKNSDISVLRVTHSESTFRCSRSRAVTFLCCV